MRRALAALPLLCLLTACDAGNRQAPGSDNAFACPELRVTTPHEGQTVVPAKAGGPVLAAFDLQGATLGRGAGSTLRYRLERLDERGRVTEPGAWTAVPDPARSVSLGALAPGAYRLVAEVLDASGQPWRREEPATEGAPRVVNAAAAVERRFAVASGWKP